MKRHETSVSKFCVHFLLLFSMLGLGCEANLNLKGVNEMLTKSSVRTDQYQEMISHQDILTLVGNQGLCMVSEDQGTTWQRSIVDGAPNFIGLSVCPDNSMIALSFDHQLWHSTDNGRNWTSKLVDTQEEVMDVYCAPDGSYWITASFSSLLHSTDKGDTWQTISFDEDALLTHIEFFDENTGIAAGEFGLFYKTTDGGKNWENVGTIGEELYPLAVHFKDENTGWVGGLSGVIMNTTDGGGTWSLQRTEVQSPIYNFVIDGQNLYAVGDQGSILVLQDNLWRKVKSPAIPVYLRDGYVIDNNKILVAGGWGALFSVPVSMPDESTASSTKYVQK
ncbi:MAG: glycosyl hydrolase [bacterium]|nr:glycosyl hydrolase [bacterium]